MGTIQLWSVILRNSGAVSNSTMCDAYRFLKVLWHYSHLFEFVTSCQKFKDGTCTVTGLCSWSKWFNVHMVQDFEMTQWKWKNTTPIASMKETLPNWVIGCSVCSWTACARSRCKKSRKEVVDAHVGSESAQSWNVTIASSMSSVPCAIF